MATVTRTVKNIEEVERQEVIKRREVEEVEEEVEVPVCDFCDQEFPEEDPDSYLTPVVLNPQVEKRSATSDTVKIPMENDFNKKRELYRALLETQLIDFQRKRVMDCDPVWQEPGEGLKVPSHDFDDDIRDDLIAYEFIVRVPEPKVKDEGSIEVCEFCKEEFR